MTKARILLFLGIWVAVLPFLGFPSLWKNLLFVFSGLVLVYFSYALYKDFKMKENPKKIFDNFSENKDFNEKKVEAVIQEMHEPIESNQEETIKTDGKTF